MTFFVSIQNTHHSIEIAIFNDEHLLSFIRENKIRASKTLIPLIAFSLLRANIRPDELSFIAVNQGPGPFTTLRVIIATANGLSFATKLPLIGIDALDALLQEYSSDDDPYTIVLLNAFNNDVYFAIQQQAHAPLQKGYKNIDLLLQELHLMIPKNRSVRFLGNGVTLHEKAIRKVFGTRTYIPEPLPTACSIKQIGIMGLQKWRNKESLSEQLMPLYLKTAL